MSKLFPKSLLIIFGLFIAFTLMDCKRQTDDFVDCAFSGLTADFDYIYDETTAPAEVVFENKSEKATSYEWDFGVPGGTTNVKNPKFVYETSGSYTIKLKAILKLDNGDECIQRASKQIIIF